RRGARTVHARTRSPRLGGWKWSPLRSWGGGWRSRVCSRYGGHAPRSIVRRVEFDVNELTAIANVLGDDKRLRKWSARTRFRIGPKRNDLRLLSSRIPRATALNDIGRRTSASRETR